jgi:serine/threonine protein kinase
MSTKVPFIHSLGEVVSFDGLKGQWRIVEQRRGGFGEVHVLESLSDSSMGKLAAKTPRGDRGWGPRIFEAFEAEVRNWLTLPTTEGNLLPCLLVARNNRRPYAIMPFVDGGNLRAVINEGPVTDGMFTQCFQSLLVALKIIEVHRPEAFHGDIKPENVLLGSVPTFGIDYALWLSDFGLYRAFQSSALADVIGDMRYVPPEVFTGQGYSGRAVDMHCLGVCCWEMLTGHAYYILGPDTPSRRAPHQEDHQRVLTSSRPTLDREILECVSRLLSADPEQRPRSFADLYEWFMKSSLAQTYPCPTRVPARTPTPDNLVNFLEKQRQQTRVRAEEWAKLLYQARNLVRLGSLNEAEQILDALEARIPGLACVLNVRAVHAMLKGDRRVTEFLFTALEIFQTDIEQRAAMPDVYVEILCGIPQYMSISSPPEIREVFLSIAIEAVRLAPNYPLSLIALGKCLIFARRFQEAVRVLNRALSLDSNNLTARCLVALANAIIGRYPTNRWNEELAELGLPDSHRLQLMEYFIFLTDASSTLETPNTGQDG